MRTIYPADHSVSIWVGTFPSEDAFDLSSDRDVEAHLKLPTPLAAIAEVAFEEDAIPTRKLLEGFAGWESFIEEAAAASAKKAVSANSALVCYHLRCTEAPDSWGDLFSWAPFAARTSHEESRSSRYSATRAAVRLWTILLHPKLRPRSARVADLNR
jgi:hypothetical protein